MWLSEIPGGVLWLSKIPGGCRLDLGWLVMLDRLYCSRLLLFLGQELWGHIDGSDPARTEIPKLAQWTVKDARVMSWILGSVDPQIFLNLRPYKTAKTDSLSVVQEVHEQSKRDQLLMKLRPKFEATHSNVMNRDPSPSLDVCFGELIREEQHLATQTTFQQDKMTSNVVAYAAHGKGKGRDMRKVQCFSCKEYGHIAAHCSKKSCNYYKKPGHIIKECPIHPQNRQNHAYQAAVGPSSSVGSSTAGDQYVLTPEMVQQMIMPAFSALGLQGLVHSQSEVWHKRLGHPNSIVLSHMFNSGLLGNKEQVSKILSFDCSICKLGKSKTLSFPSHGSRAAKCFNIVHSDSLSEISILPCYDELPPLPKRFKPEIVYTRRLPTLPPFETDPSSAPDPVPSAPVPIGSPKPDMPPTPSPQRSARVHALLISMRDADGKFLASKGSFLKRAIPIHFGPSSLMESSQAKGFCLSSYGSGASTVEPFLIDEKRITAKHVVFWADKHLAAEDHVILSQFISDIVLSTTLHPTVYISLQNKLL
ncbi:hypothetical protein HHK36_005885 [Tetracentron sinense]|uniref:CCHC-type domain-containing protein n=1 Tax=Tetracentron sinense TaxID=13715 RepID=A0A834ZV89_TETSI|nr:hypothetical protein HHK36_005885 [Tetracentron sinense]